MKKNLIWLILIASFLLLIVGYFGIRMYQEITRSVEAEVVQGLVNEEDLYLTPPPSVEEELVVQRLRGAGLNEEPVLGDTAVVGHLQRLKNGEFSEETLLQYADDLIYLNEYTEANGAPIPPAFGMYVLRKWKPIIGMNTASCRRLPPQNQNLIYVC